MVSNQYFNVFGIACRPSTLQAHSCGDRDRTYNLAVQSRLLHQLSYSAIRLMRKVSDLLPCGSKPPALPLSYSSIKVGMAGVEPAAAESQAPCASATPHPEGRSRVNRTLVRRFGVTYTTTMLSTYIATYRRDDLRLSARQADTLPLHQ